MTWLPASRRLGVRKMRDLSFAAIARLRLLCGNRVDSIPVWCYMNEHRVAGVLSLFFTARTATAAAWLCCADMSRVNLFLHFRVLRSCARSVLHVQSTYERSRWLELSGITYIPFPSPQRSSRRIPITDVRDRNLSTQAESDAPAHCAAFAVFKRPTSYFPPFTGC